MVGSDRALVDPGWLGPLAARTDMGALVAAFDWSSTSLGPVELWPSELRVAVRMCLSTTFPMLIVWGDDLIKIYNDGYVPILGPAKHPQALGSPVQEVWPEIWDTIGPMFESVVRTGEPTWDEDQRLLIDRNGALEEGFFTYAYSPLYDDDGVVRGVVDIVTETTASVLATRRLGCLAAMNASLFEAGSVTELSVRAVSALSEWGDCLQGADLYLQVNGELALVASNRRNGTVLTTLQDVRTDDGVIMIGAELFPGTTVREVAVPVGRQENGDLALLVAELPPERPYDTEFDEFLRLLAQSIGSALGSAIRHAVELDEYRAIGDVLQEAMLKPASNFPTVAARYIAATGNLAVGGDWYDVVELSDDRRALVVGDCVGHGLEAAAAMSQLRAAARSMLLQGLGPAAMLDALDRYAHSVDGAFCATAACVVVDRSKFSLTYSRAGHPPPLVVAGSEVSWLDGAGGVPLGVSDEPAHPEATFDLAGDEIVIMYSDGLVERRHEPLDEGFARLADAAAEHSGESVHDLADSLIRSVLPDEPADDVVLVVKRIPLVER